MTAAVEDRLLSARDAEKVLGIPASTVRTWFQRKARTGLWDYGRDQRGHPMFREADLIALRDRRRPRIDHRPIGVRPFR